MFGYAVANPDKLNEAQMLRYRGVYCGICRTLGENRARYNRLTLTYDLVLLALTLSSVNHRDFEEKEIRCAVHPVKPHLSLSNEYTDYAADMNILLAYYKFLDDKNDEGGLKPSVETALFQKEAKRIGEKYPRLCEKIESCLKEISAAEKRDEQNPDVPAHFFGDLLGSVFSETEKEKAMAEKLYDFGYTLGKVIYIMDAAVDIKVDLRKGAYNPLTRSSPDHRKHIIELLLSQCIAAFESLQLGQDREILENILLSGIWSAYDNKKKGEKESERSV